MNLQPIWLPPVKKSIHQEDGSSIVDGYVILIGKCCLIENTPLEVIQVFENRIKTIRVSPSLIKDETQMIDH